MNQRLLVPALALAILTAAFSAAAQDTSILKPPKGSKLALIVFEDLQCPDCRRAEPQLQEAVKAYKIPLMRYDFPLPMHNWAFDAHVMARWFDTKSKAIGEEFRGYIFENQPQITRENLRGYAERFAARKKLALPFLMDPTGALAAKVKADVNLGKRVGVSHTPTIYVVSETTTGKPFVEVVDRSELFALIDEMKRNVK
jgi:protein-disulfide isomerase